MTQVSRTTYKSITASDFPNNTSGLISPADLRGQLDNIADSSPFMATGKIAAPTVNDDSAGTGGNGSFNEGDLWIDELNNNSYICLDATPAAAQWFLISGANSVRRAGPTTANDIAFWTADGIVDGDSNLTWDGTTFSVVGLTSFVGNMTIAGTINSRDISADGTKLDGIESGATADQTGAEIKALYEAEADTNAFTDAEKTKLAGIDAGAEVNPTGAEIVLAIDTELGGTTWQGGGGGSISVEDEGIEVVASTSTINFVGAGVSVADAGSGEVTVTISGGGGSVSISGTPANNQLAVWTAADTIEGDADLTWNGSELVVAGDMTLTSTNPLLKVIDSNQPADQRRIDISGSAGNLTIFAMSDAGLPQEVLGTFNRSGTLISGDSVVTRDLGDARYLPLLQRQVAETGSYRRVLLTDSGTSFEMDNAGANTIEIIGEQDFEITGASQTNPVVITTFDTDRLVTGDTVTISGVDGMTELNGNTYTVTVINGTTFSLDGVNGTGFTAFFYPGFGPYGVAKRNALNYPAGFHFEVIQKNNGATTLRAGANVQLNGSIAIPSGVAGTITARYDVIRVRKMTTGGWIVDGDIGPIS
jgi:hypothetical protein